MSTRLAALALALTLPLAACADDPETVEVEAAPVAVETDDTMMDDDAMMTDGTMTDGAMASDVTAQGTLDAVNDAGGFTSMAVSSAAANIDGWIAQLEGNPDFAPTVADLRTLKDQLMATPIDGSAVGATLSRLGEQTTAAAAGDAGLEQLGSALSSAGTQLQ